MRYQNIFCLFALVFLVFIFEIPSARGQFVVKRNKLNRVTAVRIVDTVNTRNGRVVIDTTIAYRSPRNAQLYPTFLSKSIMTPSAWGGNGDGILFAGLGGTFPAAFSSKSDLIAVAGLNGGDPVKFVNISVMANVNDVSRFSAWSGTVILCKHLSPADAVSIGAIHIFPSRLSDSKPSYYAVYSHAVQWALSRDRSHSVLQYSVGVGSGRFYERYPMDEKLGRGKGTAVFANVSYEVTPWLNTSLEWSGINLHAGASFRLASWLPLIDLGLADITRLSGDRLRFLASLYYAARLWKNKPNQ
jgi:hypothetical protein